MTPEDQRTLQRVKQLEVTVYRGLHLNARNTDTDVIDQWIERKVGSSAALEKLLNHIHVLDFFPTVQDESELEGFADEIAWDWKKSLIDCDPKYRVIKYEGYGPEVTFYYERGELDSLSISFFLRTVDGWSPRVMQGFRLFSGAGSTGGWNGWDRRLGGRDQG